MAFTYPIGVPAAWVDPDVTRPARPSPWSSEVAGYYYVNEATGTDSGRPYGTPAAPRQTIPNPIPAGSYVEVVGTYSQDFGGGLTIVSSQGTAGAWVANTSGPAWLVGLDEDNRPFFSRILLFVGSYLCVEYITGDKEWNVNHPNAAEEEIASNMLIRYCEMDGGHTTNSSALKLNGTDFSISEDIIVYSNTIHGYGPLVPDIDRDYIGIFNGRCERIWNLDNHIYEMAGVGIQHTADTGIPVRCSYVYNGRNHVHNCWAGGIAFKTCEHVVMSENIVHDTIDTPWSNGWGIGGQYAALDVWMIYNEIYNCDNGIRVASTNDDFEEIFIFGNLIYNIYPTGVYDPSAFGQAAIGLWGGDNRFVLGNTVYDCVRGMAVPHATSNEYGLIVEFNIFCNMENDDIYVENDSATSRFLNNVFYRGGGDAQIHLGSTTYSLATIPDPPHEGNVGTDPMFVDPSGGDFRVQASIPQLSLGMTFDVFSAYEGVFSVVVPPRTYSDLVSGGNITMQTLNPQMIILP